eukprot:scaffold388_cov380-Prasinococcus_capsulatus_cf.AAC.1
MKRWRRVPSRPSPLSGSRCGGAAARRRRRAPAAVPQTAQGSPRRRVPARGGCPHPSRPPASARPRDARRARAAQARAGRVRGLQRCLHLDALGLAAAAAFVVGDAALATRGLPLVVVAGGERGRRSQPRRAGAGRGPAAARRAAPPRAHRRRHPATARRAARTRRPARALSPPPAGPAPPSAPTTAARLRARCRDYCGGALAAAAAACAA